MKNRIEICSVGRWQLGALLALCCLVTGAWLLAADWPTFRNDASNAGASPETITLPLTEVWHSSAPDVEENGVVVANGIAYMMDEDGQLYAFTVSTGFTVAGFPVSAASTFGTPAVDVANGRIYVLAGNQLWAFNLNGTSAFPPVNVGLTGNNYSESPILDGGFVYFEAGGMLRKYNSSGVVQWAVPSTGDNTQPAISGNFVYKNTNAGLIRKYNKATGTEVIGGGFPITTTFSEASLAVVNGRIFHKADELRVYDATTGLPLWNQLIGGTSTYSSSPAVANGAVYVFGWDGRLYAFNESTGAPLTGFPSVALATNADRNYSSPVVAGDKVFVAAGTTQRLKVLGAAGSGQAGQVLEEHLTFSIDTQGFDLCSPAVSDGYVFAMLDGGGLYAFFGGGGPPPSGALQINGGAECTASQNVTLTLDNNNNPNVTEMRISEDPFFTGASFVPYQQTFPFTLSAGFGTKTVYAQLKNNDGTLSNVFNDQISYQVKCHEIFPAEQCCGEKPRFSDPAYASVFTGQVAVATEYAPISGDFVVAVVDLKNQASAPPNTNYAPPIYNGPSSTPWTRQRLGDIFGLTLDDLGNIYVTATTAYPLGGFFPPGATGGEIYKIDGVTGAITMFKRLPNSGAGLGNIAYDCTHRNFYVSDIDDGLIYRLDLNGNILSTWDHGANLPTAIPPAPAITGDIPGSVYTKLGRRVWGLQAHHDRLYYAAWWEDLGRRDPGHANEVWSIALNGSGNFVPGTDKLEITMPVVAQDYSNPVSDISFGPAGTMLLTERTISGDNRAFAAHQSRALEYTLNAGTWTLLNPAKFQISSIYPPGSSSGSGGYDFAAGGRVWVTGDALHLGGNDNIYGLQGLPASGGSILNSILIDLNGVTSMQDKTEIGGVEIPCPDCEINGTVVTPSTQGGSYTYQFSVTNHSNQPASDIVILPVSGVTSITPQTFHISPPLAPGQTSQVFTITLGGAQPGVQACFNIALVSADGSNCCSRQVCVPIPSCFEVLDQRVQRLSNNMARVTVTLKSLESYTLYYAAISVGNGKTATPDFFTLSPPVPPLGITTVSTIISPVAPGETVFYTLSVHYDYLEICCSRELSFTDNGTPPPGGTPTPTPSVPPIGTPPPYLLNVSTRLLVQPGDNVGIGGVIITGTAPKHAIIRAIGPSLTQLGVPNALADTVLELHGPGAFATITNDNWRDDPVQEAAILATGLAPTNNLESAIDATLNPGAYTAVVRGQNDTSGVALIEVYDLSQAVLAKLANLSTRAFVSTGDNIAIAGFVLGGESGDGRIALRGIGPSLTAVGVTNALADPTLELRDGNGALLLANNDWQDDPTQASELMFAGLAPTNPLESGIVATLPAGTYTALLAGQNNGTGVGLVEFYDLNAAGRPKP